MARIAIDYDGTYTRAPEIFRALVISAKSAGHEVVCVTMRTEAGGMDIPCEIVCTDALRKGPFMENLGRHVDIWIDDHPEFLF